MRYIKINYMHVQLQHFISYKPQHMVTQFNFFLDFKYLYKMYDIWGSRYICFYNIYHLQTHIYL